MTITRHIVKMPSGKYLKNWDYSQGMFSAVETEDILQTCEVFIDHFNTFLKNKGGKYLTVEFDVTIFHHET